MVQFEMILTDVPDKLGQKSFSQAQHLKSDWNNNNNANIQVYIFQNIQVVEYSVSQKRGQFEKV